MDMARHYLAEAVGNADKRLINITVSETARMKQSPVRCPLKSFFNRITSHNWCSPNMVLQNNLKIQTHHSS
jgi:hypothetical protein